MLENEVVVGELRIKPVLGVEVSPLRGVYGGKLVMLEPSALILLPKVPAIC